MSKGDWLEIGIIVMQILNYPLLWLGIGYFVGRWSVEDKVDE